jgi:hypothetical protein
VEPLFAHFVLDQNFPLVVTGIEWPPNIRITRLGAIEPQLVRDHEDWEIITALDRRGDVSGFITNDAEMLAQAPEMVALQRARVALVVTEGVGHDPIRATGLVMVHIQQIAKQVDRSARIYVLKPANLISQSPGSVVNALALRLGVQPNRLVTTETARMRRHLEERARISSHGDTQTPPAG